MEARARSFKISVLLVLLTLFQAGKGQIYFGITPIRVEQDGNPGDSITDIFYVRNNSDSPLRLKVYSENWELREDGTPVFIGAKPVRFSCREWIKINPQDFRLMPNEVKMVRYTVTIPEDTQDAGYHASVSFENVPLAREKEKMGQMLFTGKIAAVVYVKVGDVVPEGKILDVAVSGKEESTEFFLILKNLGKTYFRTKGSLEITDPQGAKAHEVTVPNEVVLPESQRKIKCILKEKLPKGNYKLLCKLDIGREELIGFRREFSIEK